MNENEAVYCLKADSESHSEVCEECDLYGLVGCNHCQNNAIEIAIKALEEIQQYRAIGTPEECRAAMEKQTETLTVDEAKTIAAKAICIGCGYLAGCKCNYNGGNCMVSKPMLESVSKSFDDWNRRANDETY